MTMGMDNMHMNISYGYPFEWSWVGLKPGSNLVLGIVPISQCNHIRVVWLYSFDGYTYDSESLAVSLGRLYEAAPLDGQITIQIPVITQFVRLVFYNMDPNNIAELNAYVIVEVADEPIVPFGGIA